MSLLLPAICVGPIASALADVIEVPADYATIQAAIDASQDGDEIIIAPGTYEENIDFLGRNIIVRSEDPFDDEIVEITAIHGDFSTRVVTMSNGALQGLTIRYGAGGIAASGDSIVEYCRIRVSDGEVSGAGVLATDNAVIRFNEIQNNYARDGRDGGGVYANHSAWVVSNLIRANEAAEGGGVWAQGGALIESNFIELNCASDGGGIYLFGGAIALDNEVVSNTATEGGGVWAGSTLTQVIGNYIHDNLAEDVGFRVPEGGGVYSEEHAIVRNNIIESNWSESRGGGIYATGGGDSMVEDNLIISNTAEGKGGGAYCSSGVLVTRNVIMQNTAVEGPSDSCCGGGCYVASGATVRGNLIMENAALCGSPNGGGACCAASFPSTLWFTDNTLTYNVSAEDGAGLYVANYANISGNLIAFSDGEAEIHVDNAVAIFLAYNCIYNDEGELFTGDAEQLIAAGTGNLAKDPLLAQDGYHLLAGSPCANAGDPFANPGLDIDGQQRIRGGRIDIGADETDAACPLDFDCDGVPNVDDNCAFAYNPDQLNTDGDNRGDACDPDDDNDAITDEDDNCQFVPNVNQRDLDADGIGDFCDDFPRELLIWDNGDRAPEYGAVSSQIALDYPFESGGADDVLLNQQNPDASPHLRVTRLDWCGVFDTGIYHPIDAFHIYFYENAPSADLRDGGDAPTGGPDDPTPTAIYAAHLPSGGWMQTHVEAFEYDFAAALPTPALLERDARYWLEIQIEWPAWGTDQYFWRATDRSQGWNATYAFDIFGLDYWSRYLGNKGPADVAFTMTGEEVPGPGDVDLNGAVDLHDAALFQQCFSGKSVPFDHNRIYCFRADIDGDDDVDRTDYIELAVSLQSYSSR